MRNPHQCRQCFAGFLLFVFVIPVFFSCETHRFDRDNRQIMAKDEIRNQLHKIHDYNITGFREDTIDAAAETGLKKEIRYQLDIQYIDSNNTSQQKIGDVFFTPDGLSIVHSTITDK